MIERTLFLRAQSPLLVTFSIWQYLSQVPPLHDFPQSERMRIGASPGVTIPARSLLAGKLRATKGEGIMKEHNRGRTLGQTDQSSFA